MPQSANQNAPIHTTVNLDGKAIAHVVTKHQVAAANGPSHGPAGFDASRAYTPTSAAR